MGLGYDKCIHKRKDPSPGIKPGSLLAILRYPIIDMSISET